MSVHGVMRGCFASERTKRSLPSSGGLFENGRHATFGDGQEAAKSGRTVATAIELVEDRRVFVAGRSGFEHGYHALSRTRQIAGPRRRRELGHASS